MPRDLILGTAGHIDHGKTSLVKALTGIDCDRLPEEKARGITIDIGFARLEVPELVEDTFLATAPIIETSANTGAGIDDLKQALAKVCADVAERSGQSW